MSNTSTALGSELEPRDKTSGYAMSDTRFRAVIPAEPGYFLITVLHGDYDPWLYKEPVVAWLLDGDHGGDDDDLVG